MLSMRSINCNCNGGLFPFRIIKNSGGFGGGADNNKAAASADKKKKKKKTTSLSTKQSPKPAPRLTSQLNSQDIDFQERLNAIKRSALEQKKTEEKKQFGAIDYDDAPISISDNKTIGFATKVGIAVAVALFALVFALGDFLPSGSPNQDSAVVNDKLSEKDKAALQSRLKEFEATFSNSPRDPTALEVSSGC